MVLVYQSASEAEEKLKTETTYDWTDLTNCTDEKS